MQGELVGMLAHVAVDHDRAPYLTWEDRVTRRDGRSGRSCCQKRSQTPLPEDREGAFALVGDTGIEPVTSSV